MQRRKARAICSWRAISAFAMLARYSFRISAAWSPPSLVCPAVSVLPGTLQTGANAFPQDLAFELGEDHVIWASERDGGRHVYLYDGVTGQLKNQITKVSGWCAMLTGSMTTSARSGSLTG